VTFYKVPGLSKKLQSQWLQLITKKKERKKEEEEEAIPGALTLYASR
jgi:hypothetical protein